MSFSGFTDLILQFLTVFCVIYTILSISFAIYGTPEWYIRLKLLCEPIFAKIRSSTLFVLEFIRSLFSKHRPAVRLIVDRHHGRLREINLLVGSEAVKRSENSKIFCSPMLHETILMEDLLDKRTKSSTELLNDHQLVDHQKTKRSRQESYRKMDEIEPEEIMIDSIEIMDECYELPYEIHSTHYTKFRPRHQSEGHRAYENHRDALDRLVYQTGMTSSDPAWHSGIYKHLPPNEIITEDSDKVIVEMAPVITVSKASSLGHIPAQNRNFRRLKETNATSASEEEDSHETNRLLPVTEDSCQQENEACHAADDDDDNLRCANKRTVGTTLVMSTDRSSRNSLGISSFDEVHLTSQSSDDEFEKVASQNNKVETV